MLCDIRTLVWMRSVKLRGPSRPTAVKVKGSARRHERERSAGWVMSGQANGYRNSREWSGLYCLDLTYKTQVVRGADDQRG